MAFIFSRVIFPSVHGFRVEKIVQSRSSFSGSELRDTLKVAENQKWPGKNQNLCPSKDREIRRLLKIFTSTINED